MKTTTMTLTDDQLDQLKKEYARLNTESMDHKTMDAFVFDTIYGNLENYNESELIEEIKEMHGDDECDNLINSLYPSP